MTALALAATRPVLTLRAGTAADEQAWCEAALASSAPLPHATTWLYTDRAIVLGAGQQLPATTVSAAGRLGLRVVTRRSGGTAVFTGGWLVAASLVVPASHRLAASGPSPLFELVADAHVAALARVGVSCRRAGAEGTAPGDGGVRWACFGSTGPQEIVAEDGRKLVGLAQTRRRTGVLVAAGTLLAEPDWELFCRATAAPSRDAGALAAHATSCACVLGHAPDATLVARELAAQLDVVVRRTA